MQYVQTKDGELRCGYVCCVRTMAQFLYFFFGARTPPIISALDVFAARSFFSEPKLKRIFYG